MPPISTRLGICSLLKSLPFSKHSLVFTCLQYVQVFCKHWEISPLSTMSSFTLLENFLPFSSNLKSSSANCFSLEGSKNLSFSRELTCEIRESKLLTPT